MTSWLTGSASHAGIRAWDVANSLMSSAESLCLTAPMFSATSPAVPPGQGSDGVSGRPVRRNQLPGWSMAQDDGLFTEFQTRR